MSVALRQVFGIGCNKNLYFGFVAEEVEKVNPDLVARDAKGEVYTVRSAVRLHRMAALCFAPRSPLLEIARVLARLNDVASGCQRHHRRGITASCAIPLE